MREKIISFNNKAALFFVIVFPLVAAWFAGPGGIIFQAIVAVIALSVACVLTGLWFVLVGIYDELKYANLATRSKLDAARIDMTNPGGKVPPPPAPRMRVGDNTPPVGV